ncbi:HD domain-containing protein [Thalassospira xiamenensis]|uniref:Predicted metal-dependent phosphohydrolase, HD superfamily n=1 Tax=Thalassospira xiamenensis TaxID=220697 RepID=A0A285TRP6_9PROT|nr:hypothetical protein [Thalassospira xiamenensis]SOC25981.1 Predicted metal-dependent phosphohydrolase, HD superfamily [Thalassospira xiamenensis]
MLEKLLSDRAQKLFRDLRPRYEEPHRSHHGVAHIVHCLRVFLTIEDIVANKEAFELALIFHDATYDVGAKAPLNEKNSANLMMKASPHDREVTQRAYLLILATADHRIPPIEDESFTQDCALFLDIDNSVLGSPRDEYQRYANNIRQEYLTVFSEEEFNRGRQAFLEGMLDRESIFLSRHFRNRIESIAQRNIRNELSHLQVPPSPRMTF